MSDAEWKTRCEAEWSLQSAQMPECVNWQSVYEAKPFGRNLLKNPSPYGFSKINPPPEPQLPPEQRCGPPCSLPDGDFTGWTMSTEVLPYDTSGIPPGAVVCDLPQYSWFSLEQVVDLKAEGLCDELMDDFQPEIVIQDWYEESQLDESIYQLHVKLLGADKSTVIAEHTANPIEDLSSHSHTWKEVSHVFSGYGPGVRYVHFLHRLKSSCLIELSYTKSTDSSVIVRPIKTNQLLG